MNLAELRQAHASAVKKMAVANDDIAKAEAEVTKAADGASDDQKKSVTDAVKAYEAAKKEANDLAAKIEREQDIEKAQAQAATPREVPEGSLAPAMPKKSVSAEERKEASTRLMMAGVIAKHTGGEVQPEEWIEKSYGSDALDVIKATQQLTDAATGGNLSLPDFAETIIEGLDNMAVVRRMRPQTLTVPGSLILPSEISAPSGSWLTENAVPEPGNFTFGDIRLDPKRLAVEVVVSRKLLDQAARGGAAVRNLQGYLVRRMQEKLAVNEDAGFLRGSGTDNTPTGLRSQVDPGHVNAISGTASNQIEADLRSCVTRLQEANIMIQGGNWIMPPRTRAYLADLRDPNGNKIYPSIDQNGTLHGYPVLMTNQVPTNLNGSDTEIMFFDGPSIIIGNDSDAVVRTSIEGSYQSGGVHHSLIQKNEMLIHIELAADIKMERPQAGSILTDVSY